MSSERDDLVVVDEEGDETSTMGAPSSQRAAMAMTSAAVAGDDGRIYCQTCDITLLSVDQWSTHVVTKTHIKKSSRTDYDERDLFVDEKTNAYRAISGTKSKLAGAEYIITDLDDGERSAETKCILCTATLKDASVILDHLRSQKHIGVYITKHFPEIYRWIQRKAKSKAETHSLLMKTTDDLIRKYGKKEPLCYQKGYYQSLSAQQRIEQDMRVAQRHQEADEQREHRMSPSETKPQPRDDNRSRSSSARRRSTSPGGGVTEQRHVGRGQRSRSRSRETSHYQLHRGGGGGASAAYLHTSSRHREPHRDERAERRRSRTPPHDRRPYARDRYDTRDTSGRQMSPTPRARQHFSHRAPERWETHEQPKGGATDYGRRHAVDLRSLSGGGDSWRSSSPVVDRNPAVDQMEQLPTDEHVFEELCKADMTEFPANDNAYIQDLIDNLNEPVIGMDFVAEYSDARGQYEPGYLCTLCAMRMNPAQAVKHALDEKHAMTYLKKNYEKKYTALCISTLSEEVRLQMREKYLAEIVKKDGDAGRKIALKILLPADSRQVFRHHKKVATPSVALSFLAAKPNSTSGGGDVISAPSVAYSSETEKALQWLEMERDMPPYCEKNLEQGWYSARRLSIDYYRKMLVTTPGQMYFSIRDPYWHTIDMYGDWNPQLMRRLQDKFNFKLEHIRWLQKLLSDWRVPMSIPLQMTDLRPLEQEVEEAVLIELVDHVLKPVSVLRYMQVFEYGDEEEGDVDQSKSVSVDQDDRRVPSMALRRDDVERTSEDVDERRTASSSDSSPRKRPAVQAVFPEAADAKAEAALSANDRAMLAIIDQVLNKARQQISQSKNLVLKMLAEFENAREALFRLATTQPQQLQQLVKIAKNPVLNVPVEMVDELRLKLEEVVAAESPTDVIPQKKAKADTVLEDAGAHRKPTVSSSEPKRKNVVVDEKKSEDVAHRVDAVRQQMLQVKREEDRQREKERQRQPPPAATERPARPPSAGLQILTPKVPVSASQQQQSNMLLSQQQMADFQHQQQRNPSPPMSANALAVAAMEAAVNRAVVAAVSSNQGGPQGIMHQYQGSMMQQRGLNPFGASVIPTAFGPQRGAYNVGGGPVPLFGSGGSTAQPFGAMSNQQFSAFGRGEAPYRTPFRAPAFRPPMGRPW